MKMDKQQKCAAASAMLSQLLSGVMDGDKATIEESREILTEIVKMSDAGQLAKLLVGIRAIFDLEAKSNSRL